MFVFALYRQFQLVIWCVTTMNLLRHLVLGIECIQHLQGRRGRDRMVVGLTTTYAISAYHHWCCEFESRSGRGVQHYVIKFVSDLRRSVVLSGSSDFLHQYNWPPWYNWNIVESGVKHHQTNKHTTFTLTSLPLNKMLNISTNIFIV
jgi:hypothetical protein